MKVLYYNWCPLQEREGGGIAIYQRNLLQYWADHPITVPDADPVEPFFLCSGFYYDGRKMPYIREEERQYGARVFSLVNSPVYAPMRAPLTNFSAMLNDETVTDLIGRFLEQYGPFDCIHFQTLEGLPLKVLTLKERYENTTFLYSVHNYTAICPNVMLWTEDGQNCEVNEGECAVCMARYNRPTEWVLKNSRRLLERQYNKLYYCTRGVKFVTRKFFPGRCPENREVYREYIRESVRSLNKYMDRILAVSGRVKDIMVRHGVDEHKVQVCYIGTRVAESAHYVCLTDPNADPFGIVYMGYMTEEKGFYFLLDALEQMEGTGKIQVTFATKVTDRKARRRIEALREKYYDIRLFNGYTHADIPNILRGAHLGIVPVLWEDNLPQVAIEMIASGVPVLASSFGGASELNDSQAFRFAGGNRQDFHNKLMNILGHRELLASYWTTQKCLTTMACHARDLILCAGR